MMILVIALMAISMAYLVLLLNRKFLGQAYSFEKQSILGSDIKIEIKTELRSDKKIFFNIGKLISVIVPEATLRKLEFDQTYLGRDSRELYVSMGQSLFALIFLLFMYSSFKQPTFLMMSVLLPIGIMAEIPVSVSSYKKNVDKAIPHIVDCLKILVVNTETPLSTALELIIQGLPAFMPEIKTELLRLIQKAEKTGMRETLMEWKAETPNFKDFIALLISINEGASKTALKTAVNSFIEKAKYDKEEMIKNNAENMQLYLLGPVILMFLVILYPMFRAIQYVMATSGIGA